MLRVLFYFHGGTFQSSFRLWCPKSFKYSRLAWAVGGPAWTWRLGSHPQGTGHSTSEEGSFAGTSSTAPTPFQSILGTQRCSGSRDGTPTRVIETWGECHWRFFSVVFSLKLFFTVYWNRVNLQCGVGFACWALCSVTWIHARICIFQFLSHLGYYRVLSRVSMLYSRSLWTIYFTYITVYTLNPTS